MAAIVSPTGTTISPTSGGSITDATGTVYTMGTGNGGEILANGTFVVGSNDTAKITIVNGVIWAEATPPNAGPWFTLINGMFTQQPGIPPPFQTQASGQRIWGRVGQVNGIGGSWVAVTTDANGFNTAVSVTNLAQVLKLNLGESPFFGNFGIPAQQSVMTQVQPDFYVNITQQQFAPQFASLIVQKQPNKPNAPRPTYDIDFTGFNGSILTGPVPT
jgi:hypothetical protein